MSELKKCIYICDTIILKWVFETTKGHEDYTVIIWNLSTSNEDPWLMQIQNDYQTRNIHLARGFRDNGTDGQIAVVTFLDKSDYQSVRLYDQVPLGDILNLRVVKYDKDHAAMGAFGEPLSAPEQPTQDLAVCSESLTVICTNLFPDDPLIQQITGDTAPKFTHSASYPRSDGSPGVVLLLTYEKSAHARTARLFNSIPNPDRSCSLRVVNYDPKHEALASFTKPSDTGGPIAPESVTTEPITTKPKESVEDLSVMIWNLYSDDPLLEQILIDFPCEKIEKTSALNDNGETGVVAILKFFEKAHVNSVRLFDGVLNGNVNLHVAKFKITHPVLNNFPQVVLTSFLDSSQPSSNLRECSVIVSQLANNINAHDIKAFFEFANGQITHTAFQRESTSSVTQSCLVTFDNVEGARDALVMDHCYVKGSSLRIHRVGKTEDISEYESQEEPQDQVSPKHEKLPSLSHPDSTRSHDVIEMDVLQSHTPDESGSWAEKTPPPDPIKLKKFSLIRQAIGYNDLSSGGKFKVKLCGCVFCFTGLVVMIALLSASVQVLEPLHYGLDLNRMVMEVGDQVYEPGRHFLGLAHEFIKYPSTYQFIEFSEGPQATGMPLFVAISDGQFIRMGAAFFYQLRKDEIRDLYDQVKLTFEAPIKQAAISALLNAATHFGMDKYVQNRAEVAEKMSSFLKTALDEYHCDLISFHFFQFTVSEKVEAGFEANVNSEQIQKLALFQQSVAITKSERRVVEAIGEASANLVAASARANATAVVANAYAKGVEDIIGAERQSWEMFQNTFDMTPEQMEYFNFLRFTLASLNADFAINLPHQ